MARPEDPISQRKEAIKTRCPFLKTFLDANSEALRSDLYYSELESNATKLRNELKATLGENVETLTLLPLAIHAKVFGVFDQNTPPSRAVGVCTTAFLCGYEIGDLDEILLFIPDVAFRFEDMSLLNPEHFKDEAGVRIISFSIHAYMAAGAALRSFATSKQHGLSPSIEEFLKGLNFDLGDYPQGKDQ